MKLYAVADKYIDYLRQFDYKVYDNKEDKSNKKIFGYSFNNKSKN